MRKPESGRIEGRSVRRHRGAFGSSQAAALPLAVMIALSGCGGQQGVRENGGPFKVTCTIGMIADITKIVGGEHVAVTGLMGPGVDPHLYKASEGDLEKLGGAQLILYNGLNLEGKMGDLFVKMSRTRSTVAVTEAIPESLLREPPEFQGHYDPHVWFDVSMWQRAVGGTRDALIDLDPPHRDDFTRNAASYLDTLSALHQWVKTEMATVPRERRVLVTAHDAFGYFGRAYDVEVVGLQGISTVSEFGLADVTRLVRLISTRKIKAVFVESSVPRRSIDAVVEGCQSRGHDVRVGGTLYSDAMGAAGTPDGTYVGMVRANVRTIVQALR